MGAIPRIFISAVTDEFGQTRKKLRDELKSKGFPHIEEQSKFPQSVVDTIDKLDELIKECDVVVHIVGHLPGAVADERAVNSFLTRFRGRQFLTDEPKLKDALGDFSGLTYTQWEALLALNRQKGLLVYANSLAKGDASQAEHMRRLSIGGRYADRFESDADLLPKILWHIQELAENPTTWWLERCTPAYLHKVRNEFSEYEQQRMSYIELRGAAWDGVATRLDRTTWKADDLQNIIRSEDQGVVLLAGEGGSGKTFTLRKAVADAAEVELAKREQDDDLGNAEFPIYVSPGDDISGDRGYDFVLNAILDALTKKAAFPDNLDPESLEDFLVAQERVLVCFDNLEDLAEVQRNNALAALKLFAEEFNNARVVIAARTAFVGRMRSRLERFSGLRRYRVAPLSIEQIARYLRDNVSDKDGLGRLLETVQRREWLELASLPLFLFLIVNSRKAEPTQASLLKSYVAKVINSRVDASQQTEDVGQRYEHRLLKILAENSGAHQRTFSRSELEQAAAPFRLPDNERDNLIQRLEDTGLLHREGGAVRFFHQRFHEYFCGLALYDNHLKALDDRASGLKKVRSHQIPKSVIALARDAVWTDELGFAFSAVRTPQLAEALFAEMAGENSELACKCLVNNEQLPASAAEEYLSELEFEFKLAKTDVVFTGIIVFSLIVAAVLLLDLTGLKAPLDWFSELVRPAAELALWQSWPVTFLLLAMMLEIARHLLNRYVMANFISPILQTASAIGGERGRGFLERLKSVLSSARLPVIPGLRRRLQILEYSTTNSDQTIIDELNIEDRRTDVLQVLAEVCNPRIIAEVCKRAPTWPDAHCRQALEGLRTLARHLPKDPVRRTAAAILARPDDFRFLTRFKAYELAGLAGIELQPPRQTFSSALSLAARRLLSATASLGSLMPLLRLAIVAGVLLALTGVVLRLQGHFNDLIRTVLNLFGAAP